MAITLKKLSGDTEVIANPTLDGSETALSGLQIDGVKYAMGGGGKLYEHNISMSETEPKSTGNIFYKFECRIITKNPEPFTYDTLLDFLPNEKTSGGSMCSLAGAGYKKTVSGEFISMATNIYRNYDQGNIRMDVIDGVTFIFYKNWNTFRLYDWVREI